MGDITGQYRDADGVVGRGRWGLDDRGIRILMGERTRGVVEWADVKSVEIIGPETVSSRVTVSRVALIGVFALAAKKGVGPGVTVYVKRTGGDEFQLHTWKLPAQAIRSWFQQYAPHVLVTDDEPAGVVTLDIPEQIKKLADLRDSGVLTDEEFQAKKAELLARL